jgi:hypothetical protein
MLVNIPYMEHMGYIMPGKTESITGWWFGTFYIFPYIGKNNPN